MKAHTEILVIGSGIAGLSTAYAHAVRGRKVTVLERDARPVGATIRNFGMIWPIGQSAGWGLETALRSRKIWEKVAAESGLWHDPNGSLHLAYALDELAVLEEFNDVANQKGYQVRMMTASEVAAISPAVRTEGLLGGLYSATEMLVEPREAPARITALLQEKYGVDFLYSSPVTSLEDGIAHTSLGTWTFDHAFVGPGADLETLFPEILNEGRIVKVKLQMMRSEPQPADFRMGPSVCGGLTLTHYKSFQHCETLTALKQRIQDETPFFPEWGIHVMAAHNGRGEVVIGDSHEYGQVHEPFLREDINEEILKYLNRMLKLPVMDIREKWYGVYAKSLDHTVVVARPFSSVTLVAALGGAGMTLSFGLADRLAEGLGGEA